VLNEYPQEVNGHVPKAEELYNMGVNRDGWANLEGVPPLGKDDTQPDQSFPLGNSAAAMRYAQSFKPWGRDLQRIKIGLSRVGNPTKPIKVSVRPALDGEELCSDDTPKWCGATIRPEEVVSTSPAQPTYVELLNPGGNPFAMPLENQLYYVVIQFSDNPSEPPDPNNYYRLSATLESGPLPGLHRFTDEESVMFQGTDENKQADLSIKLWFRPKVDYKHLLTEMTFTVKGKTQTIQDFVREGTIDEVWFFEGAHFGLEEGVMVGKDGFRLVAGPILPDLNSGGKAFAVMGFNYSRPVGLMLHDMGHRTEGTMWHVYGQWNGEIAGEPEPKPVPIITNWDKFSSFKMQISDRPSLIPGCGNTHYPPNSTFDGDYMNTHPVTSTCEDWRNYPNLKGVAKPVSFNTWGGSPDDPDITQKPYFDWWLTRLPKADGCNPDARLNNWWRYIIEPDYYKYEPETRCRH
jgi:hypothetical protein